MTDDTPEYLKAFGPVEKPLRGFDERDLPGFKEPAYKGDAVMDAIVRPMPDSQFAYPLPETPRDPDWLLYGEPRPVQIEALRRSYGGFWLKQSEDDDNTRGYRCVDEGGLGRTGVNRGWAHFMEQRLGKTPVLLNEFELLRRDHGAKWAVVIAPQQFKPEWGDEADRFRLSAPSFVFNSSERGDATRWIDKNRRHGGLIAINYEATLSEATCSLIEDIARDGRSLIAFDESISIKNNSGTLAKNILQLSKEFIWRRDLTGKPVVQGPHDLWMQLRCIGALNGINPMNFKKRYATLGGFKGKKVTGTKNEEELQELLSAWSFLARRSNWLKTPGKDYAPINIEMIPEQKAHYKRMEQDFITELERDGFDPVIISAEQIIGKLLKLQQLAGGFIIDETGRPHDIMPPSVNPKLQAAKRMLRDQIDHKVIIFAHYRHSIELLRQELSEFNPAFIVGDAQARAFGVDVQSEKRRFNGDNNCRVVIGQEQAIRYGHTLMGTPTDPCLSEFFYENNYSLNDRSQCEERPQGAGQVGAITIYDFLCAPIDKDIVNALRAKEDISAAALNYARSTGVLGGGYTPS